MTTSQPRSPIYQLRISLRGIRPPIWRRILVESETTLDQLHSILQAAMGWDDDHLHQFAKGSTCYSTPDSAWESECLPEAKIRLRQLLARPKDKLVYEYDFGDCWEHNIVLERILEKDAAIDYPTCLAGKRACPPEDCGGVGGYYELLEAGADKDHPEHQALMEWIGGRFDPETFALEDVNRAIQRTRNSAPHGKSRKRR